MSHKLFDNSILTNARNSLDSITNVVQAATESSIIGQAHDLAILPAKEEGCC